MASSKMFGVMLITISALIALLYIITLVIVPDIDIGGITLADAVIRFSVLIAALLVASFLGYIGYLIVTSPVPKPVEEFIKEYKEQVGE